jgi:hypothetical protein
LHDEFDVDKISPVITVSITNKALTSNVATLTTSAAHGLTVGMTIVISDVDATFNGSYRVTTVPTTTTFTYAKVASNVTSTAVSPAGSGVTILNRSNYNKTGGQYAVATIVSTATNTFITGGDMQ